MIQKQIRSHPRDYSPKILARDFGESGFAQIDDLLNSDETARYAALYNRFLDGTIRSGHLRADLGAHIDSTQPEVENITQIMWPSHLLPVLHLAPAHQRARQIAQALMGEDMAFDFDMLIDKAPHTDTLTPWHQDAAYWIDMPDTRCISFWIAIDPATVENGCMWFVPGSHRKPLRKHRPAGTGNSALACDADESEGTPVPLSAGGATLHTGHTLHYSRGNQTDQHRRALILNFRPQKMIELERIKGFDHGLTVNERRVRSVEAGRDAQP